MEVQEVIDSLHKKGYLISPEALEVIIEAENPEELARNALEKIKTKPIIEKGDFETKVKTKISPEKVEVVVQKTAFKPLSKEYDANLRIIGRESPDSSSGGKVEDFVVHFRYRYNKLYDILKTRGTNTLMNIGNIKKRRGEKVKLIGMINDVRETKNGHIFMVLEDLYDSINALIPSGNRKLIAFGSRLINDEVIAVEGRLSKDLFIIDNIYQPDVPVKDIKTIEEDLAIAMISDTHVGSRLFMKDNLKKFLCWLKGEVGDEKQRKLAGKIKYISIAGDLADGIGVYPKQEEELDILDIFEQYKVFSEFIQEIPEYIQVIISPGNHDAIKTADPQPKLPEELVPELYKMENVTLVGSPAMISVHGLKELIYHGTSFIDFVNNVPGAQFKESGKIMIEMLKRRHLHPIYGGKPISPGKEDALVIDEVPDLFHTGESHTNSYEVYKGVICVNSGTWQQITPYQLKLGHFPTPAVLPIVEMKYGKISVVHFDKPM